MDGLRIRLGLNRGIDVDNVGHSGGLALWWREENEVQILHYSKNHIHSLVLDSSNKSWMFTGIYGEPETHKRGDTWELLQI